MARGAEDEQAKAAALARATLNLIASLISVPLQNNFDWGAGPTAEVLKQEGHSIYGALVNHAWSFAGESGRSDVNRTFLQPFVSYTTKTFTSFGMNTISGRKPALASWPSTLVAIMKCGLPATNRAKFRYGTAASAS
jgi:hypothetical protein